MIDSKNRIVKILRTIFYAAFIILFLSALITFFGNKKIIKENKKVKLAVYSNLLCSDFTDKEELIKLKPKLDTLKNLNVTNIIFRKISLWDYVLNGDVAVKNGYELINLFKSQGIVNPFIFKQLKHKDIKPENSYIMIHNQELYVKLLPALNRKLYPVKVNVYEDEKFKYDGDISNNYIIEINESKENYLFKKLFYSENMIEFFNNAGFEISLINPDKDDLYFDYHTTGIFTEYSSDLNSFKSISNKLFTLSFNAKDYYYFSENNKIKYLPATSFMINRKRILERSLEINNYDFIIYSSNNKKLKKNISEIKELNRILNKKGYEYITKWNYTKLNDTSFVLFVMVFIVILVFYLILLVDSEKLLFSGYLGITIVFVMYFSRLYKDLFEFRIIITSLLQILSMQFFFAVIRKRQILNLFKGLLFVFLFLYLSIMINSEYMFFFLTLSNAMKNIIAIFIVLSFIFGLYFYRKRFESKFLFNFVQILLFISVVIILFRNEFGYKNLFVNFYNKLIKGILITLL